MPRVLTERGLDLLDSYPPELRGSYEIQAYCDAWSREIQLFEDNKDELILNYHPQLADRYLGFWEQLMGLPVEPEDKTVEERVASVLTFFQRLRKSASGTSWCERIDRAVGEAWTYVEDHPQGWRGMWTLDATALPAEYWQWVYGSAGNLRITDDGWQPYAGVGVQVQARQEQETHTDQRVVMEFVAGTNQANAIVGVHPKELANGDYLEAYVYNNTLKLQTKISGSWTVLTSTAATLTTGTRYWLVGQIDDNVFTGELWTKDPDKFEGTAVATVSSTLAGGAATALGIGVLGFTGFRFQDAPSDWRFSSLWAQEIGFTVPDYTLRITIPFASDSAKAYEVEQLVRSITPAHIDIQVFYDTGFVLGESLLGEEGLA